MKDRQRYVRTIDGIIIYWLLSDYGYKDLDHDQFLTLINRKHDNLLLMMVNGHKIKLSWLYKVMTGKQKLYFKVSSEQNDHFDWPYNCDIERVYTVEIEE